MTNYSNHSKMFVTNRDNIQSKINDGTFDAFDFVICKDTHEMILIMNDYSLFPVKSRVYRFSDTETAEKDLNEKYTDIYEGQIVAILSNRGTYEAYIVNKRENGRFYVEPLNGLDGDVDYDSLQHRPITNLEGVAGAPVIIDTQKDGIYRVNGSYKISDSIETVFSSVNNNLFIVEHVGADIRIKKIGTDEIIDYTINQSGDVVTSVVPTTKWLEDQGYITEDDVDKKLEALGVITQAELEKYVQDVIDATITERIEVAINDRFKETTNDDIFNMFTK